MAIDRNVEEALTEAAARLDEAANNLAELDLSQEKEEVIQFLNSVSNMLNQAANALDALKANLQMAVESFKEDLPGGNDTPAEPEAEA